MADLEEYLTISEMAKLTDVSEKTLRVWENLGKLSPDSITDGGHRRYKIETARKLSKDKNKNICFIEDQLINSKINDDELISFWEDYGISVNLDKKDKLNLLHLFNNFLCSVSDSKYEEDEPNELIHLMAASYEKLEFTKYFHVEIMNAPVSLAFTMGRCDVIEKDKVNLQIGSQAVAAMLMHTCVTLTKGISVKNNLDSYSTAVAKSLDNIIYTNILENTTKLKDITDEVKNRKYKIEDYVLAITNSDVVNDFLLNSGFKEKIIQIKNTTNSAFEKHNCVLVKRKSDSHIFNVKVLLYNFLLRSPYITEQKEIIFRGNAFVSKEALETQDLVLLNISN